MNLDIANSTLVYFKTLFELNQQIFTICGMNIDHLDEKVILDAIHNIPRLIPFRCKEGQLHITHRNGLMEYKSEIDYLEAEYNNILKRHHNFLLKANYIRNKSEHKMHVPIIAGSIFDSHNHGSFIFNLDNEFAVDKDFTIQTEKLIEVVKDLNLLYSKIQKEVKLCAENADKTDYPIYRKLVEFPFDELNRIYDSNLGHLVGKMLSKW